MECLDPNCSLPLHQKQQQRQRQTYADGRLMRHRVIVSSTTTTTTTTQQQQRFLFVRIIPSASFFAEQNCAINNNNNNNNNKTCSFQQALKVSFLWLTRAHVLFAQLHPTAKKAHLLQSTSSATPMPMPSITTKLQWESMAKIPLVQDEFQSITATIQRRAVMVAANLFQEECLSYLLL